MSTTSKLFKWITFALEAFFAIPIIGGTYILSHGWIPLGLALVLHIIAIVFLLRDRASIVGNGLGVVTSFVGIIPIVGWLMHGVTALVLLIELVMGSRRRPRY